MKLSFVALRDRVNGGFELFAGFFICLNIMKVLEDKAVAGVDWRTVAFFTCWSFWNLYYYPKLGQKASAWGALVVAFFNAAWLSLLIWYS